MELPFSSLRIVNIEPTNFCNLNCEHCGDDKTRPTGFISVELAERIARQCQRDQEIRLFLSGEPLFHPRLDQLIRTVRRYVDKVVIHTNATRMTPSLAQKIIEAGLTHLSISFDGLEKDEYERVRRGASFDEVRHNIDLWLRINEGRVHTTLRRIAGADQSDESLERIIPGADAYVVIPRHSWDVRGKIPGARPLEYQVPCCFIVGYLSILWDGRAALCCADLNGRFIIGDAKSSFLEQIWNGAIMKDIRTRQASHLPIPEICSQCERYPF